MLHVTQKNQIFQLLNKRQNCFIGFILPIARQEAGNHPPVSTPCALGLLRGLLPVPAAPLTIQLYRWSACLFWYQPAPPR